MTLLDGVLVADFSRILAGPYATMLMADLGATVVKVESPVGDETRRWGPPWVQDSGSTYFASVNRNKLSISLDLKDPDDLQIAKSLVAKADILVENFLPGRMETFGLAYHNAVQLNPSIVYCSISGFGKVDGVNLPGYDLVVQAMSGLMSITGPDPQVPVKTGFAVADVITGLHALSGALAGLHQRARTGRGHRVEVNLFSSLISGMVNFTGAYVMAGEVHKADGTRHPSIAPYEAFHAADRPIIIAVGNDRQFQTLCSALGAPELASREDFSTNQGRVEHRGNLAASLNLLLSCEPAEHWFRVLTSAGVPCGPVNDIAQGVEFAQGLGLEPIVTLDGLPQVASPFHGSPPGTVTYERRPPTLDGDRLEVLRLLDREGQ